MFGTFIAEKFNSDRIHICIEIEIFGQTKSRGKKKMNQFVPLYFCVIPWAMPEWDVNKFLPDFDANEAGGQAESRERER